MGGPLRRPPPPRPVGRWPAIRCLRHAPPGYTRAVGVAGRPWASGAARSAANRSVRRGGEGRGGGIPLPWFAPPPSPGRPLKGPLRLRRPGRRRSAVGRQRAGRERAGGSPGVLAVAGVPPHPGCSGLCGGVRGCCLFGLPPSALGPEREGRGGRGGPLVPWRRPPTAARGRPGGPGPGGQPSAGGSHSSPAPLYLARAGPSCRPSLGSPVPLAVAARSWPAGAAVRVSGQRLVGCGAVGSPPRSLSPPTSRGRWHALLCHAVSWGGRGSGGPAPPGGASPGTAPPPPLSRVRRLGRYLRRRLFGGWGCGGCGVRWR